MMQSAETKTITEAGYPDFPRIQSFIGSLGLPETGDERVPTGRSSPTRYQALDVARGLAVSGMLFAHFVPNEKADTLLGHVATGLSLFLEDKSAALFSVLVGMSWAIQAGRAKASPQFAAYVARRALSLAVAGIIFHLTVWPTDILLPFALMMPLCLAVRRVNARAVIVTCVLLVASAPAVPAVFGDYIGLDWNMDGSHAVDHSLGWATLRYLVIDGNYPLVPWMSFPLLGMVMIDGGGRRVGHAGKWFQVSIVVAVLAQIFAGLTQAKSENLGSLAPYLTNTWVPTSIPFVLLAGASAVAVVAGIVWWQCTAGLPRVVRHIALLGRASLTHYLLHICVVFVPLRIAFPNEDWSVQVGLVAFAGYMVLALSLTGLWFRRFSYGPFEALWTMASGRLW